MSDIQVGVVHIIRSHGAKVVKVHVKDWLVLSLLVAIDTAVNALEPFHRFVGEEMMSDLKYPFREDTVPFRAVQIFSVLLPITIFVAYYFRRKDVYDLHHAVLGLLFSVMITGVITDTIKHAAGRPRPNFFWRCFPDGRAVFDSVTRDVMCSGDVAIVKEGYKSFPSGHTSWSFAGLGFLAWYLSGKIRVFDRKGHSSKLCVLVLPLLLAALVGVSRVDDYWHHWQDVFAGGLLGITVSSLCYLQSFPFPSEVDGWAPYAYFRTHGCRRSSIAKVNSLRKRSPEIDTTMYASHEESPRPGLLSSLLTFEAMEAGRKY